MKKIFILLTLVISSFSYCLDTKTHVYVGQEVINDLQDGYVTIPPYGNFSVEPNLVSAILSNQSTYLMGNIGPDGFPDIIGGQMTTHPGLENGWKTDDWLKWVVDKAKQPKEIAFAYGYLSHASADTFAHTYVNWYAGDSFNLTDGEIDVELRHKFLESFIAKHQPALRNSTGSPLNLLPHQVVASENTLPIEFIHNTLLMNDDVANQYLASGTASYLGKMHSIRQNLISYNKELNDSMNFWDSSVEDLEKLMQLTSLQIEDIPVSALAGGACELNTSEERIKGSCKSREKLLFGWGSCKAYYWTVKTYQNLVCDGVEKIRDLAAEYEKFIEDVLLMQRQIDKQKAIMEALSENWIRGIDLASREYIKLSARTAQALLAPSPNIPEIQSDITEWLTCYGIVFGGVPYQGTNTLCLAGDIFAELMDLIEDFQDLSQLERSLLVGYGGSKALEEVERLKQRLQDKIKDELMEELVARVDADIIDFAERFSEDATSTLLDSQFSIDNSHKNLLLIPNMASRVSAEMHLDNQGKFSPNEFNVIYNSIILSKLSLLSVNSINDLAVKAGMTNNSTLYFGYPLFDNAGPQNILFSSIKSIDGNHQWMSTAPPYPRATYDENQTNVLSFGYDSSDGTKGFRFWADHQAREKLFLKIFKGPLTPGLENPAVLGFDNVLPSNYPYQVCQSNPFPFDIHDKACVVSWLIPILNLLN